MGLHPRGHVSSRPPLPEHPPAPEEQGGSPPSWARELQASAARASSGLCCAPTSQSLGSACPSQQGPGVPSPKSSAPASPHFLQALPNPAAQLNLLPESQPTPWVSSHCLLPLGPLLPSFSASTQGSPCKSTNRSRGRLSFWNERLDEGVEE